MTGVTRVTQDTAGGIIIGLQAPDVYVNGTQITVLHDHVMPHPPSPPHSGDPFMIESSVTVFAHSIGVCRLGDVANCLHPATGSGNVFADDVGTS